MTIGLSTNQYILVYTTMTRKILSWLVLVHKGTNKYVLVCGTNCTIFVQKYCLAVVIYLECLAYYLVLYTRKMPIWEGRFQVRAGSMFWPYSDIMLQDTESDYNTDTHALSQVPLLGWFIT